MKRLILTRTHEDNLRTVEFVENQIVNLHNLIDFSQFNPWFVDAPLISVETVGFDQGRLCNAIEGADAVVLTSKNALAVFDLLQLDFDIPICVVGAELGRVLKRSGRYDVLVTAPDVGALKDQIVAHLPKCRQLVYPRGRVVSDDLQAWAVECGYLWEEFIVYDVVAVSAFPRGLSVFLLQRQEAIVPFFSRRSFDIFKCLVEKNSMKSLLEPIQPLCISAGMLESVSGFFGKDALVAKTPDLEGMGTLIAAQMCQK